jgi:hypothetical protein
MLAGTKIEGRYLVWNRMKSSRILNYDICSQFFLLFILWIFSSTLHAYGCVEAVLVLRRQNAAEWRERRAPERVDPVVAAAVS